MPKGVFAVLEGGDGCGKSTILERLVPVCRQWTSDVVITHEPGGSTIGAEVRDVLLKHRIHDLSAESEIFLFSADRAQHVKEVIQPALDRGALVISSRYFYATLAYQGYARGIDLDLIRQVSSIAVGSCLPDVVLLLDLSAEVSSERVENRRKLGVSKDRLESKSVEYHNSVRRGYLSLAAEDPDRFVVIDAMADRETVFRQAVSALQERWLQKNPA